MRRHLLHTLAALALALIAGACDAGGAEPYVTRTLPLSHGAAGVRYDVHCEGAAPYAVFVPLRGHGLPLYLDGEWAGRPFSDLFLVRPVGLCTVTARAMAAAQEPLANCAPVTVEVVVEEGRTAEMTVAIPCLEERLDAQVADGDVEL